MWDEMHESVAKLGWMQRWIRRRLEDAWELTLMYERSTSMPIADARGRQHIRASAGSVHAVGL